MRRVVVFAALPIKYVHRHRLAVLDTADSAIILRDRFRVLFCASPAWLSTSRILWYAIHVTEAITEAITDPRRFRGQRAGGSASQGTGHLLVETYKCSGTCLLIHTKQCLPCLKNAFIHSMNLYAVILRTRSGDPVQVCTIEELMCMYVCACVCVCVCVCVCLRLVLNVQHSIVPLCRHI
jgi:hypothetical protein